MQAKKKTASCLLLLTLFLTASAWADDNADKDAVVLYFNGASWNELSKLDSSQAPTVKKYLIRGIYEGAFAMDPQNALLQFNPSTSYTDMVRRVDLFYTSEQNQKTPLSYALMMISKDMSRAKSGPRKLVSLEASE